MSKAFTSEETPDEAVLGRNVQRAARGAERPMTAEGYRALFTEQTKLREERAATSDAQQRAAIDHKLTLLQATIESVRVVDTPPADGTVRFGSLVTLAWDDGRTQELRLVGPDEANGAGKLSVESPLARVLLEQRQGDDVELVRPRGVASATILKVR